MAVQLNDTHPSIAIAELMRLLVDVEHLPGTRPGTSAPGPLPTPTTPCCPRPWRPGRVDLIGRLLPRHLEIIYEINHRFLQEVAARYPGDGAAWRACPSSRRARSAGCAWPIWPSWAAIRSTAWPPCTRKSSRTACSATFTSSIRGSSRTSPTVSRPVDGSCRPTRRFRGSSPRPSGLTGCAT